VLFTVAFTAFSLNLYSEVFYPVMSKVSQVTPGPFDVRKPVDINTPIVAKKTYGEILQAAKAEGARRGWTAPVGALFYSPGVRHLRRGLLHEPAATMARPASARPTSITTAPTGRLAGRPPALGRHRRRHLRPGAVPAAFGPDPRPARAHPDLVRRDRGRRAQRHRRGHLAEEAQGAREATQAGSGEGLTAVN
jgi:hypothetical protein